MTDKPPVPDGDEHLELPLDFKLEDLSNGEKRIVSQEAGIPIQSIYMAMQKAESIAEVADFDMADLEYAFGRIALRRRYGREADTPENADRVVLSRNDAAASDPTPAAS